MPYRPCLELGCPNLVQKGRCREHTLAHKQRRRDSLGRRVYTDPRWSACRERAIDQAHGRCQWADGTPAKPRRCPVTTGLHGHHDYPGGVEQMILDGISPFDERYVVVLCGSHHAQLEASTRARARNPSNRR